MSIATASKTRAQSGGEITTTIGEGIIAEKVDEEAAPATVAEEQ